MFLRCARDAVRLGDIAAYVPHPIAVGSRVGGNGEARLGAAAQAMGVQRLQARAFGDDHVQRALLHGRLAQAQGRQYVSGAAAGTQYNALRADLAAVDLQAHQGVAFQQRFDVLPREQAITRQLARRSIRLGTSTTSSAKR